MLLQHQRQGIRRHNTIHKQQFLCTAHSSLFSVFVAKPSSPLSKYSPLNIRHCVQFVQTIAITFAKVHRHNAKVKNSARHEEMQRAQGITLARQHVSNLVLRSPEQSCLAPSMWTVLQGHEDHSLDPT